MKAIVCHAPEDLRLDNFETDVLGTHQRTDGIGP